MFARPGLCGMGIGRLGLVAASQPSLVAQALAILAKYGSAANLYLPGVWLVSGIQTGNWLNTVGGTAATIDGAVGTVVNALGGPNLVQGITASKPILRLAGGVYSWDFVSSDNFTSTLAPENAGFVCTSANFSDAALRTILHAGADGPTGFPGFWFARNAGNISLFVSDGASRQSVVAAYQATTNAVASSGWDASGMFVGVGATETSGTKTINCATAARTITVGQVLPGGGAPMLGALRGGLLIMSALPTPSERATLRQFIASLSGVTL